MHGFTDFAFPPVVQSLLNPPLWTPEGKWNWTLRLRLANGQPDGYDWIVHYFHEYPPGVANLTGWHATKEGAKAAAVKECDRQNVWHDSMTDLLDSILATGFQPAESA